MVPLLPWEASRIRRIRRTRQSKGRAGPGERFLAAFRHGKNRSSVRIALALGVAGLEWLEYRYVTRAFSTEIYIVLLAASFAGLGLWAGHRLTRRRTALPGFERNDAAVSYRNPLFRIPMTFLEIFPVGFLVSLVSAALLRNPRLLPATR